MTNISKSSKGAGAFAASTNASNEGVARAVSALQLFLKYDVAMSSDMTLSPWVKYAMITDDAKNLGNKVKNHTELYKAASSDLALGANIGMNQFTTGLFLLMQQGKWLEAGTEKSKNNMKLALTVGAAI